MLNVSITGMDEVMARLNVAPQRLTESLRIAMTRLSIIVQSAVKEQKLTGQALSVRTGTLRRSINRVVSQDDGGIYATIGTNVVYGAVHEYGYQGPQAVRAHTRTSVLGNQYTVGAFTRQVNLPERSFLRSTLAEREGEIQLTLRQAVLKALQSQQAVPA